MVDIVKTVWRPGDVDEEKTLYYQSFTSTAIYIYIYIYMLYVVHINGTFFEWNKNE